DDLRQGTLDELARASVGAAAVRLRDALPRLERLPADGLDTTGGWKKSGKPDLMVVDSLQGIGIGERETVEEQASAVKALKMLALDAGVPILATAQLPLLTARADR